ncbi:serine/threonine protein kinase [Maublancomyces gigas]|uniref:Serine/threonine protein kinase n=1 Tax=Discina gigas TaxID=1032678 RepID=A0ABR3G7A2_9PEZI
MTSPQAGITGDDGVASVMELLHKAQLLSEINNSLISGPISEPAGVDPLDTSCGPEAPQTRVIDHRVSSGSLNNGEPRSEGTSRSTTSESTSTTHSSPPPTRSASTRGTYTGATALTVQTKLYEALAQPYLAFDDPQSAAGMGPRPMMSKSSVHGHTSRYSPASQAIFTTESHAPWTILAANDLACLVFGVTKAEVRKIGILEVVKQERREWLAAKLNSGENSTMSFPYPHSHHGTPNVTIARLQNGIPAGGNRRAKSDVFYTGSPRGDGDNANGDAQPPTHHHYQNKSRGVILCGDVVPILKRNGNTGAASLWVKEKRGGLIWVLEEISEDVALLYVSEEKGTKGMAVRFSGNIKNIFGEEELPEVGTNISDLIPKIPKKADGCVDLEQTALIHQFTAINSDGMSIPCGVEPLPDQRALRVSSFPHIAGVIVLSALTLRITSSNTVFSAALFGQLNPVGLEISELIPQFDRILRLLIEEDKISLVDGVVVPEHAFRKAKATIALRDGKEDAIAVFSRSNGISARHRDGAELKVDVQMRVVMSESKDEGFQDPREGVSEKGQIVYALWITYSRHLHAASLDASGTARRPLTPPKRPSPGQTSTSIIPDSPKSDSPISMLRDQLEAIQQSPTPPSSDDESQPPKTAKAASITSTPNNGMSKRKKAISDFVILEEMGQGAYGQVKLARYKRNHAKRVVLKYVTKRRILVDTWTRDRRLGTVPLEIHVLDYLRRDGLRHPNIVEMTDFFEDDINYYIEMIPHGLPGMDLFDYIELKVNMDEDECRSIFIQVARALHHLHTKAGVVHRDIKDENVVLDGEGNIKVIDFGSAAYIRNGPFDVFVGTIDYAAPEVLAGKSYRGKEQDVWALGVLLYTICYKENPFYNIDEIMDRELRIPFVMSEVSLDLIRLMLDRDVERRPTIEQVLAHPWFADLPGPEEALLAESPVIASTPKEI